jgi:diguanylate cyclase (GGDEF)-like protein
MGFMKTFNLLRNALGSFRGQLTMWLGGLSLACLLAVGLYTGHIATTEMLATRGQSLHIKAQSAARLLETNLRERQQEINLLRRAPLFMEGDLSGPVVRNALEMRKAARSEYAWLGVADPDGIVLQATGGLLLGQDVRQRPWFQAAQSGPHTGDMHEALLLAKLLPHRAIDQPLRFIDFAAPIFDGKGQLRGVLAAHALWSWVTDTVDSIITERDRMGQVEVLITDRKGNVLYPFDKVAKARSPVRQNTQAMYELLDWGDGNTYLTSIVSLKPNEFVDLGWRIVLRQNEDAAMASVWALRNKLLLLGAFTAGFLALMAYRLATRVSRPLEALVNAVRTVEKDAQAPVFPAAQNNREIAELSQSIASMTTSLLAREQELAKLNASLESQVSERTAALQQANHELARLATSDGLTGLCNRRMFDQKLREYFLALPRKGNPYAVLMVDADHFKHVNDTYGHHVGDAVLKQLALILQQCTRVTDTVARFGGEEFAVLLPSVTHVSEGQVVAEKIRKAVANAHFPSVGHLTVSVGISGSAYMDSNEVAVVQRADEALYQAKAQGRNSVAIVLGGR